MKRDFSDASMERMLSLVAQVENEKSGSFTDWFGDRWYDFESWIGMLNIGNYLDQVNTYHAKVIDKNNATEKKIRDIFAKVKYIDTSYAQTFRGVDIRLLQWSRYIDTLSQIVLPQNGNFSAEYMDAACSKLLDDIEVLKNSGVDVNTGVVETDSPVEAKAVFEYLSHVSEAGGKLLDKKEGDLGDSIFSYIAAISGIANAVNDPDANVVSEILNLFEASGRTWSGLYEYSLKSLNVFDATKFAEKFGTANKNVSIVGSFAWLLNEGYKTYETFVDPESTAYDNAAQITRLLGSTGNFGGKVYNASQMNERYMRVASFVGTKEWTGNQILVTSQKVQYASSAAAQKKIAAVNTAVAIGSVATSTVAGGVERYGEVSADGDFSATDKASVAVYGAMEGLDMTAKTLTFGLVDIDSKSAAQTMEARALEIAQGDNWVGNYIRDEDNFFLTRAALSVGTSAYVVTETAAKGAAEGVKTAGEFAYNGLKTIGDTTIAACETVGGWVSDAWDYWF